MYIEADSISIRDIQKTNLAIMLYNDGHSRVLWTHLLEVNERSIDKNGDGRQAWVWSGCRIRDEETYI